MKLAKIYLGDDFSYSVKVKNYVYNILSMRILKNYHFGDTPKRIVNRHLINQIINDIKKRIKLNLFKIDNTFSSEILESLVNKIMTDEDELLDLIIEGKKDDRIFAFLNKFKREQKSKLASFENNNVIDSIEPIKKYIEDYIVKNLIRNGNNKIISLNGCVNYVMSSNKFKFDID